MGSDEQTGNKTMMTTHESLSMHRTQNMTTASGLDLSNGQTENKLTMESPPEGGWLACMAGQWEIPRKITCILIHRYPSTGLLSRHHEHLVSYLTTLAQCTIFMYLVGV